MKLLLSTTGFAAKLYTSSCVDFKSKTLSNVNRCKPGPRSGFYNPSYEKISVIFLHLDSL